MSNEEPGRPRESGGPREDDDADRWPTGEESAADVGRTAVRGLLSALLGRIFLVQGLVFVLVGAGLLLGAWTLAEEEMDRRATLAAFEGRAPGVIETPFWRLDFDPEVLGEGTNWMSLATPEACARLRFRPDGGEEVATVYCRRLRGGISGGHLFTWEAALGPMPVRWVDERGMPRIELRLSPRLAAWLDRRGPEADVFYDPGAFHGPERARRADQLLASVWREIDDPFLRLLEEWSKPEPAVTVAYAPEEPARAAPLPVLEEQFGVPGQGSDVPGWVLAIILGVFGTLFWAVGVHHATLGNRWATAVLVVAGLAAVPWASGYAGRAFGHLWSEAELALAFIRTEMLDLPPELVLDAPPRASDPEAEVLAWTLETSSYWRLLSSIELRPPDGRLDSDGVLRYLADQVHRQAAALPDAELADLLAWATSVQERGGGEELGLLFVEAAVRLAGDGARPEEVRRQARRLLDAVATHRPSDNPYRLAAAERRRILDRLPPR